MICCNVAASWAFGDLAALLFPCLHLVPAVFALVGMAAVLAGSVRAPLTAIILLFEMTNDYRIILPLMFAVAVSLLISQSIQKDSVYALGLARHGIRLDRGRDVEAMGAVTVGEAMHTGQEVLPESASLEAAAEVLARDDPRRPVGMLGCPDVMHAYDIALTRRVSQRHRGNAVHLDAMNPVRVDVTDVTVERSAPCAGKKMREIPFPQDCVIASVRRGGRPSSLAAAPSSRRGHPGRGGAGLRAGRGSETLPGNRDRDAVSRARLSLGRGAESDRNRPGRPIPLKKREGYDGWRG